MHQTRDWLVWWVGVFVLFVSPATFGPFAGSASVWYVVALVFWLFVGGLLFIRWLYRFVKGKPR